MPNKYKHKILMVDDEKSILVSLKRALRELDADLFYTTDTAEAIDILHSQKLSLIISDQRMPGMTGVELLSMARDICPDSIRILLTGYADIDATVKAINDGAVRYYLNKPWDNDALLSRIQDSLDLFHSTIENRRLQELTKQQNIKLSDFNRTLHQKVTEQTEHIRKQNKELQTSFMETIKAFSILVGLRLKGVASHSQRVATLAKMLLKGMDLSSEESQDIIVASYLHDIGKMGLTDSIAEKASDQCSPRERSILYKHPILGQSCVYSISGFERIGLIIRHHHENFDGTGYPDCLIGKAIPLGSRVLRICDAFDHVTHNADYPDMKTLKSATATLLQNGGSWFDPEIVQLFKSQDIAGQYYHDDTRGVTGLKPHDLKEGMVVAQDIKTVSDVFLVPKGARLSNGMIGRIQKINKVDPIIEAIRVFRQSVQKEKQHV